MTSEERRELRFQRRRAMRCKRRQERSEAIGEMADIFTFHDLFSDGRRCCNGVRWKNSTQNFELHLFSRSAVSRRALLADDWKPKPYVHFAVTERGKRREIDAPHINDRQVQKTLTRKALYPLYTPSMIYDNGASMRGKGLHFSYKRLKEHLHWHYRHYGTDGYVVLIDLKGFFPSAPHNRIMARHEELVRNPDVCAKSNQVLRLRPGGIGMPLGVEPSQLEMVALPSKIDNFIKCQLRVHCAAHYMDDYYMFAETKERARELLERVIAMFEDYGMAVNRGKSGIQPLRKPFRFCKAKFHLLASGRIITHGCRAGMIRTRRKLRLFKERLLAGEMTAKAIADWFKASTSYYRNYNDHGRLLRLNRIYHATFA